MPLFFVLTWLKHFLLCNQPITDFTVIPGRTLVTCYTDFRESIFFSCKSKNTVYQQKIFIHIFTTVSNRPLHRDINSPFSVLLQEVKFLVLCISSPILHRKKTRQSTPSVCVCTDLGKEFRFYPLCWAVPWCCCKDQGQNCKIPGSSWVVCGWEGILQWLTRSARLLWFKSGSATPARAPGHEETAVLTHTDVKRC